MTEPMRENERIATRIAAMCGMKETTFGELSDSIEEALDSKDSLIQSKENENNILRSALKQGMTQEALSFAHDRDKLRVEVKAKEERIKELEKDVNILNELVRGFGHGQGEIDFAADQEEQIDSLRTLVKELSRALKRAEVEFEDLQGLCGEHGFYRAEQACMEERKACQQALLLIPEELREERKPNA